MFKSLCGHNRQGKHAGQALDSGPHGIVQSDLRRGWRRLVEIFLNQVRDHLGVGFRGEDVPLFRQLLLQLHVVFNDAVVNNHNRAVAVAVRMGVFFGRRSVRGPAGVANAVSAVDGIQADHFFQVAQLAHGAADGQVAVLHHGKAGGVIAAILQALKPFQQHRYDALIADVTDNS